MGTPTINLQDITTFWGCVPEPEQRTLIALAELAQTPAQTIAIPDVRTMMQFNGALPANERTDILARYTGITRITDSNPLCGDPDGCILFATSFYLGQIFACRLAGGCQVGAPIGQPCKYGLTAPSS